MLFRSAIARYKAVIAESKSNPETRTRARLRLGFCYFASKDYSDALNSFKDVIEEAKNNESLAGGYVGLGNIYVERKKLEDALFCYLRVVMLYSDSNEFFREACKQAAFCFDKLKDKNPEYASRAQRLRQMASQ